MYLVLVDGEWLKGKRVVFIGGGDCVFEGVYFLVLKVKEVYLIYCFMYFKVRE